MIFVAVVFAVATLAAGCGNEKLVVPKVTGEDSDVFQAYERLSDAGFTVEITDGFRTGPSGEAWIYRRDHCGRAWPDALGWRDPIAYDRDLRLPKLLGLRLDSVDRWLSEHKLGWSAELAALPATNGDDLLRGYVVTVQDPAEGSHIGARPIVGLEARPTEEILASWREPTVVVPHVSGDRSLLSAYDRLHARGLAVATNQRLAHGPYLPVLAQEPKAGTTVRRGTTVRLILDSRLVHRTACCDQRTLTMPDFVGRNLGEVSEWLIRRYLYWVLVDAPALPPTNRPHMLDPYVVTSQKPAAGAKIPESISPVPGDELKPIELRAKLVAR